MNDLGVATHPLQLPVRRERPARAGSRRRTSQETWRAAFAAASDRAKSEPVWAGGKSLGGRIASMAVADGGMHRGRTRLPGLSAAPAGQARADPRRASLRHRVPMIFVEGTRDPFATPELARRRPREARRSRRPDPDRGRGPLDERQGAKRDAREVAAALAPIRRAAIRERMALMPRKNRRNPEFFQAPEAPPARADAPLWAQVPGFDVRHVGGQKEYRCPGLRPHRSRRRLASGRGAGGRRGRSTSLAHRVLAQRAQAAGPIPRRR